MMSLKVVRSEESGVRSENLHCTAFDFTPHASPLTPYEQLC